MEREEEGESVSIEEFIESREEPEKPEDVDNEGPPSEECNLPDLGCTAVERQEQAESVAEIQNAMCNMDPALLEYPITMYLVQLCDGSTMYVLGAELLAELQGPYLILDELVIESREQVFSIVVTERRPLFAMKFQEYEPNGNIQELRWKITNRAPKYYAYGYDALNRVGGAGYGYFSNSTPGGGSASGGGITAIPSQEYAVLGISYDAVENTTYIQRNGMVPVGSCFEAREIDNLELIYDPASHRLNKVIDSAPANGRPYGFKPGGDSEALYIHDDNGNLEFDPHKGLSMQYNFLRARWDFHAEPKMSRFCLNQVKFCSRMRAIWRKI